MVTKEQRRKQLARQKRLRQQQRHEDARRRARLRNGIIAAGLVAALGAGGVAAAAGAFEGDADTDKPTEDTAQQAPDPCAEPAKGEPGDKRWEKEPEMAIDTSASYTMSLATTCGDIEIALDAEKAPHTVNSFNFLAGEGYFDHTPCHRLVDQGIFVLQCGDPTGTGKGGPGYTLPDENLKDPAVQDGVYPAGTVAMANTYNAQLDEGRDTGGSQFFLVYEDSELPPDYTPFGQITQGMDVLRKIADAGSTADPQIQATVPNATVVIDKATVTGK
ncbi:MULTISPECIES: peptidylprolyl isomerase [unclassified Streptomyces]|uniref:peptidylprolyl isomerase n=1 Tax=unclassified Streptomyces TaxID=2593676 RepID=UPI0022B747F5|nr:MULTISPECIES: peptidylprolyl isomerase [unclassified Streptomyces]MCZ7413301.1 peptidylprolyl isomerase [Streptomyces sp. WMMC897]MCZ7430295.1 peptidylprolyl isomerase [Streptomyces sp. WMMC1477]